MGIDYQWKGVFDSSEVESLHSQGFEHEPVDYDWGSQVERHSLGWVCARDGDELIGFVNVIWDGFTHAFILDTMVTVEARHRGVGRRLIAIAVEESRAAGCEWLHVDFEDHLKSFYFEACGFEPTNAGLIAL